MNIELWAKNNLDLEVQQAKVVLGEKGQMSDVHRTNEMMELIQKALTEQGIKTILGEHKNKRSNKQKKPR